MTASKQLIDEFINSAIEYGEAQASNQPLRKGRAGNAIYRIWQRAKQDSDLAQSLVDSLLFNSEPNVRLWICSIALDIDYRAWDAEAMLAELAKSTSAGASAISAKAILDSRQKGINPKGADLL
ncbi:MAG: hypothetical protein LBS74_04085 [Oscillospiraceae bacterium]|jgi:hypothetical protein|nr:hypothetical protein [Oscillospiraceae bacterium]